MKEAFVTQKFNRHSTGLIERANDLIDYYMSKGYLLTIRQLYYRMVGHNYITNDVASYKRFARLCNNARLAGKMDWSAIEDRLRYLREIRVWDTPTAFMKSTFGQYAEQLWEDQDAYCECWIEKDAVLGVVERPCNRFRVPFFSCRGYSSQSEMYEAGKRLREKLDAGKRVVIIYLGDHDPSGLDITRDIEDRLNMFAYSVGQIEMHRISLSIEQIRQYSLPPNMAKETDSRAYNYIEQFGYQSWELDALEPDVLDALIVAKIETLLDMDKFEAAKFRERDNERLLFQIIDKYPTISKWLEQVARRIK